MGDMEGGFFLGLILPTGGLPRKEQKPGPNLFAAKVPDHPRAYVGGGEEGTQDPLCTAMLAFPHPPKKPHKPEQEMWALVSPSLNTQVFLLDHPETSFLSCVLVHPPSL